MNLCVWGHQLSVHSSMQPSTAPFSSARGSSAQATGSPRPVLIREWLGLRLCCLEIFFYNLIFEVREDNKTCLWVEEIRAILCSMYVLCSLPPYLHSISDAHGPRIPVGPWCVGVQQDSKWVRGKLTHRTGSAGSVLTKRPCFLPEQELTSNDEETLSHPSLFLVLSCLSQPLTLKITMDKEREK